MPNVWVIYRGYDMDVISVIYGTESQVRKRIDKERLLAEPNNLAQRMVVAEEWNLLIGRPTGRKIMTPEAEER